MSQIASIRTVRRLDERSEVKEIAGVRIDKGIPVPPRITRAVAAVVMVLKGMEVGDSFVSNRNERDHRIKVKKETGREFVGRPLNGGKQWRIWRTK